MAKKDKTKKKASKKTKEIADPKDIAFEVAQVARHFRTLTSRSLTDFGLYGGQEGVMLALGETDGLTAGAIAAQLGVKAPTMTRTITRMEAQGFVTRKGDDDGRLTTVWLTDTGRKALGGIQTASNAVYETAFSGMEEKQKRRLLDLLTQLDDNLSTALSADD